MRRCRLTVLLMTGCCVLILGCSDVGPGNAFEPEISVHQDGTEIPILYGSYAFGQAHMDGDGGFAGNNVTFTIENMGNGELTVSEVTVALGDTDSFDLTYTNASPIAAGSSAEFGMCFDPLTLGAKSALVSIVNDDTDEAMFVFTVTGEPRTGALNHEGNCTDAEMSLLRTVTLSPDDKHLYGTSSSTNSVCWLARDTSTGSLTYSGRYSGADINDATSVIVTADGLHAYVTFGAGVAWFSRDAETGALSYVANYEEAPAYNSTSAAVSPDGNYVYVAKTFPGGSQGVVWFARDTATGALTYSGVLESLDYHTADSIIISPDGRHVYFVAEDSDTVFWFSRDGGTGELSPEGSYSGDEIDGACCIRLSDTGSHAYIAAYQAGEVAWFTRDGTTGALSYAGTSSEDFNGCSCLAVSHDGRYVYACSVGSAATFARDSATGDLFFVEEYTDAILDSGAPGIAISADDNHGYVVPNDISGVAWFTRDW